MKVPSIVMPSDVLKPGTENSLRVVLFACLCFGAAATISHPRAAHAQQYVTPVENCVTDFYDPASYNWLSYRNNCGTAVHVQFVANSNSAISGSVDIAPGGHQDIGRSASEVSAAGGIRRYVCPAGYLAYDTKGNYINNTPVNQYTCKHS